MVHCRYGLCIAVSADTSKCLFTCFYTGCLFADCFAITMFMIWIKFPAICTFIIFSIIVSRCGYGFFITRNCF